MFDKSSVRHLAASFESRLGIYGTKRKFPYLQSLIEYWFARKTIANTSEASLEELKYRLDNLTSLLGRGPPMCISLQANLHVM
jgi:hypothetical protein